MKGLNGVDSILFTSEGNEGTAFTLSSIVSQNRTLLDRSVDAEHASDIILRVLFR